MKRLIFLLAVIAMAVHSKAQPLQPQPSLMSVFSKAMLKELRKPEFKEKLAILMQEPGQAPDLQQAVKQAAKDPEMFASLLEATFRINGGKDAQRMYLANFVSLPEADELTEYAMYLFTQKTTGGKINPKYPAGFNYGVKKFRDSTGLWYYIVTLTGKDIELKLYGTKKNRSVRDDKKPQEVVRGQLAGNKVITERHTAGGQFYFIDGVLGVYSSNYELFFEFFECTPDGEYIHGSQPQPVFAGYSRSEIEKAVDTAYRETVVTLADMPRPPAANAAETNPPMNSTPPMYPGGDAALNRFLAKNINYPKEARDNKVGGMVMVTFVVTNEGKLKDIRTIGSPKGYGLEEEAIRVVALMPDWIPSTYGGKPMTVQMTLQIRF